MLFLIGFIPSFYVAHRLFSNKHGWVYIKSKNTKLLISVLIEGLGRAFDLWWPDLKEQLDQIPKEGEPSERRLTMRGLTLGKAIESVGLIHIENRDDEQNELPPARFYEQAEWEIFICGSSLWMTFHRNVDLIHEALTKGKRVYIMMLHPSSDDVTWLDKRENRPIRKDIEPSIGTIYKEGLCEQDGFQIRFMQKLPPFIGTMIDGDICAGSNECDDERGQIRVQTNTVHVTAHRGLIVHLKKVRGTREQAAGPFEYFARDFRKQWEDAKEDYALFELYG